MTNLPDQSAVEMQFENEVFSTAISVSMETFRKLKFCSICGKAFGPTIVILQEENTWFVKICGDHLAMKSTETP